MKFFFALFALLPSSAAQPDANQGCGVEQFESIEVLESPVEDPEGRGCCSHHGGVCGCAGARAKCCDGTLSPSCDC